MKRKSWSALRHMILLVSLIVIMSVPVMAENLTDLFSAPLVTLEDNKWSILNATAADNRGIVYEYLTREMGCNSATACGIMANIEKESSFNPLSQCMDTNGKISYGICQWNGGRKTKLENYCGAAYNTLNGQLRYLKYELETSEASAWRRMQGIENTSAGAYEAAGRWAQYFERCAHFYCPVTKRGYSSRHCSSCRDQFLSRQVAARDKYWPQYGKPTDTQQPVITNIQITDVNATGYTVSCDVSDNVGVTRVEFPTWTDTNGQDDIIWHKGTINGNRASCRITVSDHNNEVNCIYRTDIYAWDEAGNYGCYIAQIHPYIDAVPPVISDVSITEANEDGYTVICYVKDESGIEKVQFPTWTLYLEQDDLDKDWWNSQFSKGSYDAATGKVTYRVRRQDHNNELGIYVTDIYAFDKCGNWTCYRVQHEIKEKLPELTAELKADKYNAQMGETVSLTAGAQGGDGNYTYKFLICDDKGNWYKLRDYTAGNTIIWTTGAAGKKTLYVDVKDGQGTVKRSGISYEVTKKPITAFLSVDPSAVALSGKQVHLIASAEGGTGSYTYKFLVCDDKGNWYKLKDYGKGNICTWTTGAAGKKNLYVDVKDSSGTVKRTGISFNVIKEELSAFLTSDSAGEVLSGKSVHLIASAAGGTENYTYKFLVCDDKGNWYKLKDYGSSNVCTWTTGVAGKKMLYVDVKDSSGTVKRAALPFKVKNEELTGMLVADVQGEAVSGSVVRLIASANGGSGSYTYKFLICDDKGNWYKLRDYGTGNICTWIPGALGKKTLYVDIKDSTGKVVRQELAMRVTDMVKSMEADDEMQMEIATSAELSQNLTETIPEEQSVVNTMPEEVSEETFSAGESGANAENTLNEVFSAE